MTKRKYNEGLMIKACRGGGTLHDCACRLMQLIIEKQEREVEKEYFDAIISLEEADKKIAKIRSQKPISRQRMKQLLDMFRIDYFIKRKLVTVSEVILDKRYMLDNDSNV